MLTPCTRFLSINSTFAKRFLQTSPCDDSPCVVANPSPPSGWVKDFHLQAAEHAQHTSSPLRGSKSRETGSRWRGHDSGVASINSRIVGVQRMIKNSRII